MRPVSTPASAQSWHARGDGKDYGGCGVLSTLQMSDTAEAGEGSRSCAVSLRVGNVDVKIVSIHLTEDRRGEASRMQQAHSILMQHTGGRSSMANLVVFAGDLNSYSMGDFANETDWDAFKATRGTQGQGFVPEKNDGRVLAFLTGLLGGLECVTLQETIGLQA
eukprot:CAMPEP_0206250682 /NCGR_PEP_ID=MMETSP0047_2-20121206/21614_1 /ASSEMBLY_ACC=CAM_ASM_000192 /TAXON_ID=195065 /ORGANISM="Chroomonas mesostigmatica_cf, Strain CCMP1168" /LENGTH=163 /DNA_ID=CAMNT_0053676571 /DNA_START=322 /DNA_END=813 /DNA_ORIENTATION=+